MANKAQLNKQQNGTSGPYSDSEIDSKRKT